MLDGRRRRASGQAGRAARAILAMALTLGCHPRHRDPEAPGAPAASTRSGRLVLDGMRLLGVLEALADDRLGGRYTLSESHIREAARIITSGYREAGVAPATDAGYLVDFEILVGFDPGPGTAWTIDDEPALTFDPAAIIPRPEGGRGEAEGPLVFVGYGVVHGPEAAAPFDELAGLPLDGAVAVVLEGVPRRPLEATNPPRTFGRRDRDLVRKLQRLEEAGVVAAIVVDDPGALRSDSARTPPDLPRTDDDRPLRRRVSIPVVQVHARAAQARLGSQGGSLSELQAQIDERGEPRSRAWGTTRARVVVDATPRMQTAPNILAMVPGSDLAEEIVLVGAHYDHIGIDSSERLSGTCHAQSLDDGTKDSTCNGADDNASGSAIVAELARAMTAGATPRRTVVFAHFSGEEMGLLGSRDLAARLGQQPPFAGRRVVAMLNIDMVGRLREQLTISGIGSSSGWMPLLDEVGPGDMRVLYDRSLTTRSDHAPFYEQGIPSLFFFTGLHADYHAPGDEIVGILPGGLLSVADLVARITWRVADGAALPFTPPRTPEDGLVRALPGDNPAAIVKIVEPEGGESH